MKTHSRLSMKIPFEAAYEDPLEAPYEDPFEALEVIQSDAVGDDGAHKVTFEELEEHIPTHGLRRGDPPCGI